MKGARGSAEIGESLSKRKKPGAGGAGLLKSAIEM